MEEGKNQDLKNWDGEDYQALGNFLTRMQYQSKQS